MARKDLGDGIFVEDGVMYNCPGGDLRVSTKDLCARMGHDWTPAQQAAYSAYVDAVCRRYRETQARRTPERSAEDAYEMRAAFGPGVEVINVITGQRTRT